MTEKTSEELEVLKERIHDLEIEREELKLRLRRLNRKPSNLAGYILLSIGLSSLALSIYYSSSEFALISAFIGLGLTFWGTLLLYIKPTEYAKAKLIESTTTSPLTTINQIIKALKIEGKAQYLPPRHLKEMKGGKVFIPKENETTIPPIEELAEEKTLTENPGGLYLTPPGLSLTNLYEEELGREFVTVDLKYIQQKLPKIFIEDLEIAENLEINIDKEIIHIKIEGNIYKDLCQKTRRLEKICGTLGCPLCSSIAVALTRAAGKPIIIEKNEVSPDGKTIEVYYRTLEK